VTARVAQCHSRRIRACVRVHVKTDERCSPKCDRKVLTNSIPPSFFFFQNIKTPSLLPVTTKSVLRETEVARACECTEVERSASLSLADADAQMCVCVCVCVCMCLYAGWEVVAARRSRVTKGLTAPCHDDLCDGFPVGIACLVHRSLVELTTM